MMKNIVLTLLVVLGLCAPLYAQPISQAPGTVNATVDTTALEALFGTTAAAAADNTANPTLGGLRGFTMVFDGSTWDRWTGAVTCSNCSGSGASKTDGAAWTADTDPVAPMGALYDTTPGTLTDGDTGLVRMSSDRYLYTIFPSAQAVTQSGTWTLGAADADIGNVDLELAGTAVSATNPVAVRFSDGSGFVSLASDTTVGSAIGTAGPLALGEYKEFDGSALPTTTNVGTEGEGATYAVSLQGVQYTMLTNENGSEDRGSSTTPLYVNDAAATVGGADEYSHLSAGATEDEHAVKATAGTLYSITATNTNASVRYLKCEDDTAANTAPGTDTPELRIAIPGATTGAGFTTQFPKGWAFANALTCWLVTGAADSDVAEVAANEIMVFYTFK